MTGLDKLVSVLITGAGVETTVKVSGNNIRNCLAMVRRAMGLKLRDSREVSRVMGKHEYGVWTVTLANGLIVLVTVIQHKRVALRV